MPPNCWGSQTSTARWWAVPAWWQPRSPRSSKPPVADAMVDTPSQEWVDRYLALLGIKQEAPSVSALGRLIRAQIATVPFENVASILRRRDHPGGGPVPPVDPDAMLAAWEARTSGGVCFDVTEMMLRLLTSLG